MLDQTSMSSVGMLLQRGFQMQYGLANEACRWDDDVIFKHQARGTDDKRKKEFVNVSIDSISMNRTISLR